MPRVNGDRFHLRGSGVVVPISEINKQTIVLASIISKEYAESGLEAPTLAFVAGSASNIIRIMLKTMGISNSNYLHVGIERLHEEARTSLKSRFSDGQLPSKKNIVGKHIAIVDIACWSGDTLNYAKRKIEALGPLSLKTAVVYDSIPANGQERSLEPDFRAVRDPGLGYVTTGWEFEDRIAMLEIDQQR